MFEKIDVYDIVTSLLHGTLLLFALLFFFPDLVEIFDLGSDGTLRLPESIILLVFISLAFFGGQTITALSSFFERILFWTWGGKPSDKVFSGSFPKKYLSDDFIKLAKEKLQISSASPCSDKALFSKAMVIARKAKGSLSERHNMMYAYNRIAFFNILVISFIFMCSCFWGFCWQIPTQGKKYVLGVIFLLLLIIHWYRAKQRAFYYVREVIMVAERELSGENNGVRD